MFSDSKLSSRYYKKLPDVFCVLIVSNDVGDLVQRIQVFRLTKRQYYEFELGKLSLVPYDCCNASGGGSIENPDIMFRGRFTSKRHIQDMIEACERILREENRVKCK